MFYEDNELIDIIVIIHIRNYLSTAMDRTGQSAEFTVGLYLIIKKCSVHIKVTSVCG